LVKKDNNYDFSIVIDYAIKNPEEYFINLYDRLLNNYQAPIAIDTVFLDNLKFNGTEQVIVGPEGPSGP